MEVSPFCVNALTGLMWISTRALVGGLTGWGVGVCVNALTGLMWISTRAKSSINATATAIVCQCP